MAMIKKSMIFLVIFNIAGCCSIPKEPAENAKVVTEFKTIFFENQILVCSEKDKFLRFYESLENKLRACR